MAACDGEGQIPPFKPRIGPPESHGWLVLQRGPGWNLYELPDGTTKHVRHGQVVATIGSLMSYMRGFTRGK